MVVDRFEHGWAGQLEHGCWQACSWLSWPVWSWLLTGLNMVELASLDIVVDKFKHGLAGQLEHGCWQACSRMLEQTVHSWNIRYCSQSNLASFKCLNSNCFLTLWRLRRRVFRVVDLKALKVWLWRLFLACLRFHIVLIKTSLLCNTCAHTRIATVSINRRTRSVHLHTCSCSTRGKMFARMAFVLFLFFSSLHTVEALCHGARNSYCASSVGISASGSLRRLPL